MMNKENPLNKYHTGKFEKQRQDYPGLQSKMTPVPDTGESSYQGANKLTGKKAFVTGETPELVGLRLLPMLEKVLMSR